MTGRIWASRPQWLDACGRHTNGACGGGAIDDATWNRVEKAAKQDGTTSSAIVRRVLVEYLDTLDAERNK